MTDKVKSDEPISTPSDVSVEKVSETKAILTTSASPSSAAPTLIQNAPKTKTIQPAPTPKAVKQLLHRQPKHRPNTKKAVTVDDLIQ